MNGPISIGTRMAKIIRSPCTEPTRSTGEKLRTEAPIAATMSMKPLIMNSPATMTKTVSRASDISTRPST